MTAKLIFDIWNACISILWGKNTVFYSAMLRGYGGKKNRKRRRKKSCNTKWGIWNAKSFPSIRQILWSTNGAAADIFFAPKNFCSRAGVSIKSLSLSHFFSCVGKLFFVVLPWEYFGHFYHFLFEIRAFLLVLLLHNVLKSQKVSSLQHYIHILLASCLSEWISFLPKKKSRKFKWDIFCSFWNTVFFCGFSRYIFHVRLFFVVVKNPIFF